MMFSLYYIYIYELEMSMVSVCFKNSVTVWNDSCVLVQRYVLFLQIACSLPCKSVNCFQVTFRGGVVEIKSFTWHLICQFVWDISLSILTFSLWCHKWWVFAGISPSSRDRALSVLSLQFLCLFSFSLMAYYWIGNNVTIKLYYEDVLFFPVLFFTDSHGFRKHCIYETQASMCSAVYNEFPLPHCANDLLLL